ncbi:hypothetical protein H788_YJM1248M00405 [Saccharomyces cerevisiae YJM1248]|nr:hypothetical protein H749_YJM195M00405 [Saccharomyces cerevisiae YJM195]AJS80467.1 hypothetical protein H788_YJM1248M00405 [Saccharomyces cerevisiae YJM1248]AJS94414.1 hypothetical protein H820_YJM1439M00395 [Saccharomyces cerevisiae YJM1439]
MAHKCASAKLLSRIMALLFNGKSLLRPICLHVHNHLVSNSDTNIVWP